MDFPEGTEPTVLLKSLSFKCNRNDEHYKDVCVCVCERVSTGMFGFTLPVLSVLEMGLVSLIQMSLG